MAGKYYNVKHYEARGSIGYLIRYARNLLTLQIEEVFSTRFTPKEVTFVQYVVLMHIRDNLSPTSAGICQSISYDTGAFTRLLDQMEKRGWITRKRNTRDRRVVDLRLTTAGNKTVDSMLEVLVEYYNAMLEDFTKQEADTLVRLLTKLVGKLSKPPVKGG